MTIIKAAILGIVQGFTEFLPVSSSGHLVLAQKLLNLSGDYMTFDILLHFATLLAVVIVLWKDIIEIIKHPFSKITLSLIIATIPAVILALLFEDQLKEAFSGKFLAVSFLITGLVLLLAEWLAAKQTQKKTEVGLFDALIIGLCQAVALLPGVSRAGMTLSGGLARNIDRVQAAKFSFLMSVIIILGSSGYEGLKLIGQPLGIGVAPLIVGMLAAAISGYFAVRGLLKLISSKKLTGFAIYVFVLAALVFVDQTWTHLFF
ncbi:MAG: undecaprenyl-diphosphate phosphatase [Eubacteriales bacterium]